MTESKPEEKQPVSNLDIIVTCLKFSTKALIICLIFEFIMLREIKTSLFEYMFGLAMMTIVLSFLEKRYYKRKAKEEEETNKNQFDDK